MDNKQEIDAIKLRQQFVGVTPKITAAATITTNATSNNSSKTVSTVVVCCSSNNLSLPSSKIAKQTRSILERKSPKQSGKRVKAETTAAAGDDNDGVKQMSLSSRSSSPPSIGFNMKTFEERISLTTCNATSKFGLTFSIDRLLNVIGSNCSGMEVGVSYKSGGNYYNNECNSQDSETYNSNCCKYFNNPNDQCCSQNPFYVQNLSKVYPNHHDQQQSQQQSHQQSFYLRNTSSQNVPLTNNLDLNAIIRPTPVRVIGNSNKISAMVSPLSNYHQNPHCYQGNSHWSSSIISPLNELKALHIGHQLRKPSNSLQVPKTSPLPTSSTNITRNTHQQQQQQLADNNTDMILSKSRRRKSWSRAVFTNLQRKGLEIQFQQQKYITKPERRKLAARLNLTDSQVKVWFQNRRMKWRRTRENFKSGQEKSIASSDKLSANKKSSDSSENPTDDEDSEINVVE